MGHVRWMLPTIALAFMFPLAAAAQQNDQAAVWAADDAYWRAYNACDLTAMRPLLAPDAEFFHDKTGLTTTREGIVDSLRKGGAARPACTCGAKPCLAACSSIPWPADTP
jgi:hypothetical protein